MFINYLLSIFDQKLLDLWQVNTHLIVFKRHEWFQSTLSNDDIFKYQYFTFVCTKNTVQENGHCELDLKLKNIIIIYNCLEKLDIRFKLMGKKKKKYLNQNFINQ